MGVPAFPEIVVHRRANTALRRFNADRLRWLDEAAAMGPITCLRLGFARIWVVTNTPRSLARCCWRTAPTGPGRCPGACRCASPWARTCSPHPTRSGRRSSRHCRILDEEVAALPIDTEIDLEAVMRRMALIAAAWVLLGERLDRTRADELGVHEREVIGWVGHRIGTATSAVPFALGADARHVRRHAAALSDYVAEVIERRRSTGDHQGGDVLDALLAARPNGRPLGKRDLVSHVLGLFLAGNETTATALTWTLVHAAHHPAEWAATATDPTATDHYATETLRLTPAVWGIAHLPTRRGVTLAVTGGSIDFRRTDAVTIYLRGINHDATRWPEPHRFVPSRHTDATVEQRQSLLTFGLGPRGCIGQHLAMAEMTALVPRMARRCEVTIRQPIEYDASFSLRVKGGLTGTLHHRHHNASDASHTP
jgi:cytochrome P450